MSDHPSVLDKNLTLVLNANWQPIGHLSVRKALVALCSEADGQKAARAMDMETELDEQGNPVLVSSRPVEWSEWITLPIRDGDLFVNSAHQKVRVPTILICGYTKVPMKRPRVGSAAIAARDNMTCGYSGRKLTRATFSLDHIQPRSRGGKDDWSNLISCDKAINMAKADRTPEEAGLKLLFKPTTPPSMPVIIQPEAAAHQSWLPFLFR